MNRLEIAVFVMAGLAANPAETYVAVEGAAKKALDIADALLAEAQKEDAA